MTLSWHADGVEDAPALVLLNSVGSTAQMWAPVIAPLAEQFRVLRIDYPGHGSSAPAPAGRSGRLADLAEAVVAVLDDLGLDRVDLAGLSLGGMTGMWLAIHRPERIGRLALLCTSACLAPEIYGERAVQVRTSGLAPFAESIVARWVTSELAERDPALVKQLQTMVASVDAEGYAQCCEAIAGMDLRADLDRIAAPTLIVAGAQDPAVPADHAKLLADRITLSRLEVVEGAAHVATYDQPGRVAALLLAHFRGGATLAHGYATRRAVLGDEHVDRAVEATTELTAPFQEFLTRYAWGDMWSRPELALRERSVATLAALVALGAENELAMHIRAARRNGLSSAEVIEVLMHTSLYAGLPRANRAIAIASEVLANENGKNPPEK